MQGRAEKNKNDLKIFASHRKAGIDGNKIGFRKARYLPKSRAVKPTSRAAMMVPSRTPSRRWTKRNDNAAAMTVRETSNATFVLPKLVFQVVETARTKDSPGSIATFASTSI